jgi:UDP-N-acetylglucosamine 4,6-dehydratase
MKGGEIFVPKLKSIKTIDLAKEILPSSRIKIIGIRDG